MVILAILFYLGLTYLTLAISWLFLLTIGSWLYKAKSDPSAPLLKLAVLVPAHNEELMILQVIKSIRECEYPESLLQIIIIADNCSDRTAAIARQAGITTVERHDLEQQGKGQALDWFLKNYQDLYEQNDGIILIDADVCMDKEMLTELSASLAHPDVQVVQGFVGVANPYDNWRTALNSAAYNVFNHVRMAGNNYFFGSAMLKGLAMAFHTDILKKHGWPAHSVVEDVEFSILLFEDGINVHYNPAAILSSEAAGNRQQADTQRKRWEGGRFALACTLLPNLFRQLLDGNFKIIHIIMDLLIPPCSLLIALMLSWLGFGLMWFPETFMVFVILYVLVAYYVVSGQLQRKMELKLWGYLLTAPLFIIWKTWLYLSMICNRKPSGWVRTPRKAEMETEQERKR
jgi:cellulose synthase/poly-beta-1,6-N-acetylglucosamine synthase-like glycosyltransferase